MSETILVTGGAGYIGSHTCLELLTAGYQVCVVDNLDNSSDESLRRVAELAGRPVDFHRLDLLDQAGLATLVNRIRPRACIHFAGLKAVGESTQIPLRYYHNNLTGTFHLLAALAAVECFQLVFSSSATVYGAAERVPITEDMPLSATNPYGATKLFIERVLADVSAADERWRIIPLRYFNPVGAHASGRIGEDPEGRPNNLMPFVTQVAVGRLAELKVFGNDWPTPDGTGVRDYIHVVDLARGHLAALRALPGIEGCRPVNLGTGTGSSVLEVVQAMEVASGRSIAWSFAPRRPGDVAVSYADPSLAAELLGWRAEHDLATMCADAWRWQAANPRGYRP